MAVSDFTDPVARFSNEASAQVFAKFVASEGVPCHIVETGDRMHPARYGVHIDRSRIGELKTLLRLTTVAYSLAPTAAQLMAEQLAGAGIPCYAGIAGGLLVEDASLPPAANGKAGHILAVPEPFSVGAHRILGKRVPAGFDARAVASVASEDSEHPY